MFHTHKDFQVAMAWLYFCLSVTSLHGNKEKFHPLKALLSKSCFIKGNAQEQIVIYNLKDACFLPLVEIGVRKVHPATECLLHA